MAAAISRQKILQYKQSAGAGGNVPDDLAIYEVDDFLGVQARHDAPMLDAIGTNSKEHSRVEIVCGLTDLPGREVTVLGAQTNVETAIELAVNDGLKVQQWDQLYNIRTGETILVNAVPTASAVVAERGRGAVAAAAMNNGDVLYIVSPAVPEGADAPSSPTAVGTTFLNYMQIFEYTFELSHRARVTKNYEFMDDRFRAELKRLMIQATEDLGQTALYGVAEVGAPNQTNPSSTAGLDEVTNLRVFDALDAELTWTMIMDLIQTMHTDVGSGKFGLTAMGNPSMKRIWNSQFNTVLRQHPATSKKGSAVWDVYETDFGDVQFMINYRQAPGTIYLWDPDQVQLLNYAGGKWSTGVYATNGWYEKGFLRGDYGFQWDSNRHRAKIINIETDTAGYTGYDDPS